MLLPPRLDDYVSKDNPVRALDAFVETLDLQELGFEHAKANNGIGQPAFETVKVLDNKSRVLSQSRWRGDP